MKRSIKKYIHLLNDTTNFLLKKDRVDTEEKLEKKNKSLIFITILLILSVIVNVILAVWKI